MFFASSMQLKNELRLWWNDIPKQKLLFPGYQIGWVSQWLIEWASNSVCDFSAWASPTMEAMKEMQFGTKVA